MDIFEFAMKMEKDGEKLYREIAQNAPQKGLANILLMLADDELKHYIVMRELSSATPPMTATSVLTNAKNIFEKMNLGSMKLDTKTSEIDLYKKAQKLEKDSENFYRDKSKEVKEQEKRDLLLRIAEEEKKHYFLLENMIDFLSKPKTWLENAEFVHLDEY